MLVVGSSKQVRRFLLRDKCGNHCRLSDFFKFGSVLKECVNRVSSRPIQLINEILYEVLVKIAFTQAFFQWDRMMLNIDNLPQQFLPGRKTIGYACSCPKNQNCSFFN